MPSRLEDFTSLPIRRLRQVAAEWGLVVRGSKQDLAERLHERCLTTSLPLPAKSPPEQMMPAGRKRPKSPPLAWYENRKDPRRQRARRPTDFYAPATLREQLEDDDTSDHRGIECDGDDGEESGDVEGSPDSDFLDGSDMSTDSSEQTRGFDSERPGSEDVPKFEECCDTGPESGNAAGQIAAGRIADPHAGASSVTIIDSDVEAETENVQSDAQGSAAASAGGNDLLREMSLLLKQYPNSPEE